MLRIQRIRILSTDLKKTNYYDYLQDVSPRDLSSILDFMYNGEVNVKQEHLNSFLSVAEKLRVRGLCQNNGKDTNKPKDNKTKVRAAEPSETPAKRPKFDQIDDDEIEEIKPTEPPTVKQERLETVTPGFSAAVPPQSVQVVGEAFTEEFAETEDYGEYYEDGNYGVDPVDQGQAGKGRTPFFFLSSIYRRLRGTTGGKWKSARSNFASQLLIRSGERLYKLKVSCPFFTLSLV